MTVSTIIIKNSYSGNGTLHSFAYGFKIFADADLDVIIRSSTGTETVKTLNTHYVVTNAGTDSGGNVLFKFNTGNSSDAHYSTSDFRPASGETVLIRRSLGLTQSTDYVANDPFAAEDHETALDRLTFISQEIQEELDRSIKISRTNTMTSTEFTTSSTDRASKLLAFDSSGELAVTQEIGTFKGNSATTTTAAFKQRDIVKATTTAQLNNIYICVADSVVGDALTDTDHFALLVDAVSAAASATTATTKASEAASSATAAAGSLTTFQGQYHGAASSDPSSNLDAGDLYFNTSSGMKVYNGSAWVDVKPTDAEQTNINTVAGSDSEITALAASAVIADMALLGTSDVVADMALLGNSDVIADMALLATSAVVEDMGLLGTSAVVEDLGLLATSAVIEDMGLLATSANITNMATLGASGVVANIATVANNVTGVNSFADRYRVASSDPSSNNDEGDLVYNTTDNNLKFFNGSSFVSVGGAISNIVEDSSPQLGGSLDVNGNSIVSASNGNIAITPNGSGKVVIDGISHPTSDGSAGQFLKTDGSGTLAFATVSIPEAFPSGTSMLFQQTAAPTGWTKQTTHNDKAIRLQTGTVGTGGSVAFSTAMATPAVAGGSVSGDPGSNLAVGAGNLAVSMSGNIANTSLSIAQLASHNHQTVSAGAAANSGYKKIANASLSNNNSGVNNSFLLNNTGSGSAHNHSHNLSGSMSGAPALTGNVTAGNLAVGASTATINLQYVDFIIANKD